MVPGISVIDNRARASVITVGQGAGATNACGTVLAYDRRSNSRWTRTKVSASTRLSRPPPRWVQAGIVDGPEVA